MYIQIDLDHHLQATGVGCYVGGAWVNSQSYQDDIVLHAPTVTALQTLLEVCHAGAGPYGIVYNTPQRKMYNKACGPVVWGLEFSQRLPLCVS